MLLRGRLRLRLRLRRDLEWGTPSTAVYPFFSFLPVSFGDGLDMGAHILGRTRSGMWVSRRDLLLDAVNNTRDGLQGNVGLLLGILGLDRCRG